MEYGFDSTIDALRKYMLNLRATTLSKKYETDKAASSDIRIGYIDNIPVNRLVITLRAPGCEWVRKGGGCLMCGHYAGTTRGLKLSVKDIVTQFRNEISKYNINNIGIISIYNSGSVLNPDEIDPDALEIILRDISVIKSIRKVILESRTEYIDSERVGKLSEVIGKNRLLTIALGLETSDDKKRELCVNKGTTVSQIKASIESLRNIATSQLYVLLGLPFLTESESIEDTVLSLRCANDIGADEIHIEPMTIQNHTLVEELSRNGLFSLPSIYSIYEVLRRVVPEIKPYVSPFMHMPLPEKIPGGCSNCTHSMINGLLNVYNLRRDKSSLQYTQCGCIDLWREKLQERDPRSIEDRISEALDILQGERV